MAEKALYIVQQFEKQGRKLVAGRQMDFKSADETIKRAERDVGRTTGVIAIQQTVDTETETDEMLDESVILVQHGEVPTGIAGN